MSNKFLITSAMIAVLGVFTGTQSASAQTIEMGGSFYYRIEGALPGLTQCNMALGPCARQNLGVLPVARESIQRGGWHENTRRDYAPYPYRSPRQTLGVLPVARESIQRGGWYENTGREYAPYPYRYGR